MPNAVLAIEDREAVSIIGLRCTYEGEAAIQSLYFQQRV
jgi:hypothetical protein